MELKYVVPSVEGTFGTLEFAGKNDITQRRGADGRRQVTSRTYNLYSDLQRADNIIVTLPAKAGEKEFSYMQPVRLVNPRIFVEGRKVAGSGFTQYRLEADDMLAVDAAANG